MTLDEDDELQLLGKVQLVHSEWTDQELPALELADVVSEGTVVPDRLVALEPDSHESSDGGLLQIPATGTGSGPHNGTAGQAGSAKGSKKCELWMPSMGVRLPKRVPGNRSPRP